MKILQLVPYFYPAWSYGGPAKLVYDTSQYFAKNGHSVTVYTSDAYDSKKRMPKNLYVSEQNLKVRYFKNFHNSLTYTYNIFFTPGLYLRSIIEIKKFDIIHIHDFYTLQNFWIGILARFFKIPYILSVHGCLETERVKQRSLFKNLYYALYGGKLLKYATKVIATSENEILAYKNHGVKKSNIIFIGHGINKDEFKTNKTKEICKKQFAVPEKNILITFLGRIHKIKGLDILVDAIAKLKTTNTTFIIAGSDDGYLGELKNSISQFKLQSRVTLLPACFGSEKAELFKATDIFVYPSYAEGFSLGILEAAAAGLPLVITTGCHFPQVAEYKAGKIVEPIATQLSSALAIYIQNEKLRKQASKNATRLINENYSMSYIGDKLLDIYEKNI